MKREAIRKQSVAQEAPKREPPEPSIPKREPPELPIPDREPPEPPAPRKEPPAPPTPKRKLTASFRRRRGRAGCGHFPPWTLSANCAAVAANRIATSANSTGI